MDIRLKMWTIERCILTQRSSTGVLGAT